MAKTAKKSAPKKAKAIKKSVPKKTAKKTSLASKGKTTVAPKKSAPKKSAKKTTTSLGRKAPNSFLKKTLAKKIAKKKNVAKKEVNEKEAALKEANRIINSAPKKKLGKKPIKARSTNENTGLLDAIVDGLQEKKAKNITIMDMTGIGNSVADYFVIADAESRTHVDAIANSVEDVVAKKTGEKPYHSEGHQIGEWVLVDYVNIVVHVFQKEIREFYNIEALWADADIKHID